MQDESGQDDSDEQLRSLGEQLNEPALKSSMRLLILISLALNKKLTFTELVGLTGLGKGSLSNHLSKLESAGMIQVKNIRTFTGYRTVASITDKGIKVYESYVNLLRKLTS